MGGLFGGVVLLGARVRADRMAHMKGVELAKRLFDMEEKYLSGTSVGLRAGEGGAWIEVGEAAHLCRPCSPSETLQRDRAQPGGH